LVKAAVTNILPFQGRKILPLDGKGQGVERAHRTRITRTFQKVLPENDIRISTEAGDENRRCG
jgi:hypothetical protein